MCQWCNKYLAMFVYRGSKNFRASAYCNLFLHYYSRKGHRQDLNDCSENCNERLQYTNVFMNGQKIQTLRLTDTQMLLLKIQSQQNYSAQIAIWTVKVNTCYPQKHLVYQSEKIFFLCTSAKAPGPDAYHAKAKQRFPTRSLKHRKFRTRCMKPQQFRTQSMKHHLPMV